MDSAREIENLLYTYAERIDAGDLAGFPIRSGRPRAEKAAGEESGESSVERRRAHGGNLSGRRGRGR